MMEAMAGCIIVHDAHTKAILWANPAACSALGFTLEELLPLKAPDMSRHAEPYRREAGLRWLQDAVEHGSSTIEWCYRAKHGEEILSEAIATLVRLAARDVVMVQFRNIAREDEVKRALEYLARYNAMGEMAAAIAHELSQPMAAIRNYLEGALLRLQSPETQREHIAFGLNAASRQVDHAAAIIKSVREYVVKLEQAEAPAELNAILAETRYFIELKAAECQVEVEFIPAAEPLKINCEKVLIGQVILNLAFNAIEEMQRFPEPRRLVRISTALRDGRAALCVEDRGHGIDAALHERLFDGFFTSKVSGNGIGLALCKNIIGRHRGVIWAQNWAGHGALDELPCGAQFCFALPLLSDSTAPWPAS
ncbi:MAG: PAS domain S-box protein [Burkholderiaceae bacterium]|nr:PAS domain S-box protein [Burkholderiaceae bacterium]